MDNFLPHILPTPMSMDDEDDDDDDDGKNDDDKNDDDDEEEVDMVYGDHKY